MGKLTKYKMKNPENRASSLHRCPALRVFQCSVALAALDGFVTCMIPMDGISQAAEPEIGQQPAERLHDGTVRSGELHLHTWQPTPLAHPADCCCTACTCSCTAKVKHGPAEDANCQEHATPCTSCTKPCRVHACAYAHSAPAESADAQVHTCMHIYGPSASCTHASTRVHTWASTSPLPFHPHDPPPTHTHAHTASASQLYTLAKEKFSESWKIAIANVVIDFLLIVVVFLNLEYPWVVNKDLW